MKTIITATDFSDAASNAVDYAAGMAIRVNAELLLLNVVQSQISYSDFPLAIGLEDVMRNAGEDIQQLKSTLQIRHQDKLKIETEIGMGGFFEELKDVCERIHPYAVVLGSRGKTAAEHTMFGEHAVDTARHLTWPVITVPPEAGFTSVKKIGLASDLTQPVENIPIEEISLLVKDFDAELHILNIGKQEVFDADVVFDSAQLQETIMTLKPVFHFIKSDNTDEGIIDFAHKNQIDLLIVQPGQRNFIESIFHKSHTKQLILHSKVPVVAIHK